MVGQIFNQWTIVGESQHNNGKIYFPCECSCGTKKLVYGYSLKTGKTKSCGCNPDLTGQIFERWTVIESAERDDAGRARYLCRCVCGIERIVDAYNLKSGMSQGCGCVPSRATLRHGMTETVEYATWCHMKERCSNPNRPDYVRYGGRGIKVCERWLECFENFFKDMGPRPEGTSIDRIDNNKGYSPDNCRWATSSQQMKNRRAFSTGLRRIDLTGKTFGAWTVIKFAFKDKWGIPRWECKCDCGIVKIINGQTLRNGQSKSCGCKRKANVVV